MNRPYIPGHLRVFIYSRDGEACIFCGVPENLHLDHIQPFSLGGPIASWNLRPLCQPCNSRRGIRYTADDYAFRPPVARSCVTCNPSKPGTSYGWCVRCRAYGDVAEREIDACPNPLEDGCAAHWKQARKYGPKRRKRRAPTHAPS